MSEFRPTIAISACLLGQNVRYDGAHQYNKLIDSTLKPLAQITTFCPEVAAGLGTPRPPIQLVVNNNEEHYQTHDIQAIGVDDSTLNVTDALNKIGQLYVRLFEHVDGIVFKARSPSCGVKDTPIKVNGIEIQGQGLFARIVSEAYPHIALIDEQDFANALLREKFIRTITNPQR